MKSFNFKLTIFMVSSFISIALFIFGAKNNICIGLACWALAFSLTFFALHLKEKTLNMSKDYEDNIDEYEENFDNEELFDIEDKIEKMRKSTKRTTFTMYFCSSLLIIVGFFAFI